MRRQRLNGNSERRRRLSLANYSSCCVRSEEDDFNRVAFYTINVSGFDLGLVEKRVTDEKFHHFDEVSFVDESDKQHFD